MSTTPIRVVVIDDQLTVVEALREALERQGGLEVVGSADGPQRAMAELTLEDADVVCLKVDGHPEPALEFTDDVLAQWPDLGIVVVTAPETGTCAIDAITRGARGLVSHLDSLELLTHAVRSVAAGGVHLSAAALSQVLVHPASPETVAASGRERGSDRDGAARRIALLSRRQTDVLLCLMGGLTQAQAGEALGMSPNTVRTHVQAVLRRLEVHSTLAAVALARRSGLPGTHVSAEPPAP